MVLPSLEYVVVVVVALTVLFVLLTWAHMYYWTHRLTVPIVYSSTESLKTPDGATIELRRVPLPEGVKALSLPPVLLVHGLGANHRNQDLHPDYSLARHLAMLGRDVWLLTLRSGRHTRGFAAARRVRFAAMAEYDVPMGVREVLSQTGQSQLDYVGFSMGGMLLYAALGHGVAEAQLRRVVIVGSPGFIVVSRWVRPFLRLLPRALVPTVRFRMGARLIAFASEWLHTPLHHVVCNPLNVSPGMTRAALVNVVEDVPGPLQADFMEWARDGGELRVQGAPVLDGLSKVKTPALFVAGAADKVAPVFTVRRAFEAWGREHPDVPKRFVVVGVDFGYKANYGHGDMALGTHVGVDLFEPIARFLGPEEQAHELPGAAAGPKAVEAIQERSPGTPV